MKLKIGLFDLYMFLIVLCKGLGASANSKVYIVVFIVGCAAIFVKMLRERYTRRELMSMLFIVAIGLLNFLIGHETTILFTAVAVCGMKNVDINRIIKIVFWTRLLSFITMVTISTLGVVENVPIAFWRDGHFIMRYSFGYGHPNTAHIALTTVLLLLMYLYGSRMNVIHYCILLGVNFAFYKFTYSRTGFLMGALCIMLFACSKIPRLRNIIMHMIRHSYWALFGITLALGLLYGKVEILYVVDRLLTGRVRYMHRLMTMGFPPLIGGQVTNQYVIIDNGYTAMLYEGGILAFLWISYYMTKVIHKVYAKKEHMKLILIGCFILYNMTESFYPSISVNISLLFISDVLFQNQEMESNEKMWLSL